MIEAKDKAAATPPRAAEPPTPVAKTGPALNPAPVTLPPVHPLNVAPPLVDKAPDETKEKLAPPVLPEPAKSSTPDIAVAKAPALVEPEKAPAKPALPPPLPPAMPKDKEKEKLTKSNVHHAQVHVADFHSRHFGRQARASARRFAEARDATNSDSGRGTAAGSCAEIKPPPVDKPTAPPSIDQPETPPPANPEEPAAKVEPAPKAEPTPKVEPPPPSESASSEAMSIPPSVKGEPVQERVETAQASGKESKPILPELGPAAAGVAGAVVAAGAPPKKPFVPPTRANGRRSAGSGRWCLFWILALVTTVALYFGILHFGRDTRVEGQVIPPDGMALNDEVWIVSDFSSLAAGIADDLAKERMPLQQEIQERRITCSAPRPTWLRARNASGLSRRKCRQRRTR